MKRVEKKKGERKRVSEEKIRGTDASFLFDLFLLTQRERTRCQLRLIALKKQDRKDTLTLQRFKDAKQREKILKEDLERMIEDNPLWKKIWENWLSQVAGIGKHLTAVVLGGFESALKPGEGVEHWQCPSQMCQFAGIGAPGQKKHRGKKLSYNSELKSVLLGRLFSSFLRQQAAKSGYRRLYDKIKEQYCQKYRAQGCKIVSANKLPIDENGKHYAAEGIVSKLMIHNYSRKLTMKIFVHHLFEEMRNAAGLESRLPYVFEVLGHPKASYIPPIRDKIQKNRSGV